MQDDLLHLNNTHELIGAFDWLIPSINIYQMGINWSISNNLIPRVTVRGYKTNISWFSITIYTPRKH